MDTELIQFKNVTKKFGDNKVLDSINLTIPENQITGIIGASGEGKTTILKLLIGFYKPTKGKVLYLRRNILSQMYDIKRDFGFATEDCSFYDKLTVKENLFYFGRLYHFNKHELKRRVEEVLRLVELDRAENTLAENLSIGMKKRLDIACAIIHKPKVLIMDEPTADLDPLLRVNILNLIKKINKQGTTIILTTQILNEVDKVCDRLAILYNEKIIEQDRPKKIKAKYKEGELDDVFNKIFSRRSRRRYAESINKKTKISKNVVSDIKPDKQAPQSKKDKRSKKEEDKVEDKKEQDNQEVTDTPDKGGDNGNA